VPFPEKKNDTPSRFLETHAQEGEKVKSFMTTTRSPKLIFDFFIKIFIKKWHMYFYEIHQLKSYL